ncbi:hypothetical protein GCM10010193_31750 [Kitasatospora atroaurantiaca]|uniref:Uncharacterized protein n=1 Tax=Kitasatospora atroaurantiaca TaxID=285545 RepID=A0A561ERC4_9ACTN|nr:hypothetical protein [Kitasatospora atroaurantiaca]TWE18160.1 hypothetical protein FB465_3210 [Kitasatospora atroaurantiaca]
MSARRLLATVALLATATLTLTACDGDGDTGAGPSASGTPSATVSASASTTPTGTKPTTGKPKPPVTAKPSTSKAPSGDCTAAAQHPGHKVLNVVSGAAGSTQLTATATKFVCGPNVDNDGYYEPVGASATYQLAAGATAELVTLDSTVSQRAVSVPQLIQHVNDCAQHREVAQPYSCFGGNYDITVDSVGHITHISELYHP